MARRGTVHRLLSFNRLEVFFVFRSDKGRAAPFSGPTWPVLGVGHAENGVAVEHGDLDLEYRKLHVEVPRHHRLAGQFQTVDHSVYLGIEDCGQICGPS